MEIKKINTAVLISGRGSNLKNLIKFSKKKYSPIKIDLVVSDNSKAYGISYAKLNHIYYKVINFQNKKFFENELIKILNKKKINFICLAGFMRVLSEDFIKNYKKKIINIHPSLLPKYKGLNTHSRVLKNKEKFSGCTVHYVTKNIDDGKIIMQKKLKVSPNDNKNSLEKKILKLEYEIYPKSILKILS